MYFDEVILSSDILRKLNNSPVENSLKDLRRNGVTLWATPLSIYLSGSKIATSHKPIISILPEPPSVFLEGHNNEMEILLRLAKFYKIKYIMSNKEYSTSKTGVAVITLEKGVDFLKNFLKPIPFVDLRKQFQYVSEGIWTGLSKIFSESRFVQGTEVKEFEESFAQYLGVKNVIAVNNGTSALLLIFLALGIGSGDEVITVSHTFVATVEAISILGARPVMIDIDPEFYTLNPKQIADKITSKTRAIVPVHIYGQPADMDPIIEISEKYSIPVIEDACQAHGAEYYSSILGRWLKVGTIGKASAFSFYPGKNLGTYGEGGAVVTNDDELAEKMRAIRDHGSFKKYYHEFIGLNLRLPNIQGLFLCEKLNYLDQWNDQRRKLAQRYSELLSDLSSLISLPKQAPYSKHVYHLYTILTEHRDSLRMFLKENGINTGIHYPVPVHLQKAFKYLGIKEGELPVTENVAKTTLSLPIYPGMPFEDVEFVSEKIHEFFMRRFEYA